MEYVKTGKKMTFGVGTVRTAGIGKLSDSKKITGGYTAKTIAERAVSSGIQAMMITAVILLKCSLDNRSDKN
ncbi:MAG: hypothetical protein K2G36_11655 [Ruminococcus sp.]|nr:hypothetical protein [Ruminococcus sp.]